MTDTQANGYLALPAQGGGRPVLVLHAWWGLNDALKATCTRLADAGFVVYAPDLYRGQVTDQIAQAEALATALDGRAAQAKADIAQAAAYVAERSDVEGTLAVVGFSLGAYYALDLAAREPERVASVVLFYGTGPADVSRSRASYLGHFAEDDPYEPADNVDGLETALRTAGRPVTFHRYAGVGHWFFEPDRADAYDEAAAALAWARTLAFLRTP